MASKVAPETDSTQAVALSSAKALAADDAGNEGANARSSSKSLHANTNKSSIWWTLDSLSMSAVQISEPGDEDADTKLKLPPFVVSPTSHFRVTWDVTVLLLLVYYVWIIPFRLCFMDTQLSDEATCGAEYLMESKERCEKNKGCQWIELESTCTPNDREMGLFIFDTVVDFFFLFDIALNFRTAFYITDERSSQVLITDPKLIMKNYLKSWFFLDIAGSLPLDLILFIIEEFNSGLLGKDVNRLPRILRIAKVLRFLKLIRAARIGKVIERIQEEVNIRPGLFRVVKFFFVFITVAHLMACSLFWLGTVDQEFLCQKESTLCKPEYVYDLEDENTVHEIEKGQQTIGITWLTQTSIVSRSSGEVSVMDAPLDTQYLLALYWAVTTMTTVGYGDIKPYTVYEVTACILCMIIGATTFSYVVGNMASLISKLDGLSGAFREKMDQATVFMHENHIPKDLKLRIRKYYDYSFNHPMVNLQGSMLQDLSPALYNEVVRFIRRDVLASVSLFSSLNNKQRRHLLSALQPKLIPTQHGPSDYIFYSGELGKSFYIVVTGEVDLIDPETREVFATFRQGNYFGENALLPDEERRPFTVRARSWCDILAMRVKDLEVVLHDFPSILSSIRLTARLRWARLLKAYEAHRVLVLARQRKIHVNGKTLLRVMSRIDDQGAYTPFEPSSVLQLMEDIGPDKKKQNKSIGKDSEDRLKDIDSLSIEEQQSLLVDLKDTVLHSEVGKQLAAGIRLSGRSGWDWSRDWVDGDDIPSESTRLSAHYNGAALADKAVKKTVGDRGWKSFTQADDEEDHQPMSNLNLDSDHVAPGVALGRALERIISRLDVIEAQTDMHEVLVQLKRLNQLSAERNEAEKEKSLNVPINLMTSGRGYDQGGVGAANSDRGSQSQADFQGQEM